MGKILLFLSLASIVFLGYGVHTAPYSELFLLASNANNVQHVRILVGIILAIQLVTRPPRHIWFRIVAGSIAVFTGFWTIAMSYTYHLQLLDMFAFMAAACAMFATSLERSIYADMPVVTVKNKVIV